MAYRSRLSREIRESKSPRGTAGRMKRIPMTASEVRAEYEKALDEWNVFATRHKHEAKMYKEEFDKSGNIRDPYEAAAFLEDLTLSSKHSKHFIEATRLLNAWYYWSQRAAEYRVDEAVILAKPDDVPYWWSMLDDSSPINPYHMPTKGQVFDMGKNGGR